MAENHGLQERKMHTVFSLHSFCNRVSKLTTSQRTVIKKMGFGNLLDLPSHDISKILICELMDHWNPEDHHFVLRPGILPITLQDVVLILGLPVTGHPVILDQDEPFSETERYYKAQAGRRRITIDFLEQKLDQLGDSVGEEFIRTFLLYIFGAFLFVNTNRTVDSRYLLLLKDLDCVCNFSWGTAMLEYLYFWLDSWKNRKVSYVGGCMVFLLIWCYEHIDIGRPQLINRLLYPRICRWQINKPLPREFVRRKFGALQDHQIIKELQHTEVELKIDHVIALLMEDKNEQGVASESYSATAESSDAEETKVDWKEKIQMLQSENSVLKEKNMNLEDGLKVSGDHIGRLEEQNTKLEDNLKGVQEQIAKLEEQNMHLKSIIGGASDIIDKLKI